MKAEPGGHSITKAYGEMLNSKVLYGSPYVRVNICTLVQHTLYESVSEGG